MLCCVYVAVSLDGFIARTDGSLDWLPPVDAEEDYGYGKFISHIDAIVMGRNTYEFAITIDPWPYTKPVYVLSTILKPFEDKQKRITVLNKSPAGLVSDLRKKGFRNLYIDGGRTIRGFMADNLIDEWIITRIPVILGSGIPLFGDDLKTQKLVHSGTTTYTSGLVQSRYRRDRKKQRI